MSKLCRNEPCHCGSGKKYKKCCLRNDQEAAAAKRQEEELRVIEERAELMAAINDDFAFEDDIDDYSNRVLDLIDEGDLEAAETACQELEEKFPEYIDVPERRAELCEARGEFEQAIKYYERCLEIIAADPEGFETGPFYEDGIARSRAALELKAVSGA